MIWDTPNANARLCLDFSQSAPLISTLFPLKTKKNIVHLSTTPHPWLSVLPYPVPSLLPITPAYELCSITDVVFRCASRLGQQKHGAGPSGICFALIQVCFSLPQERTWQTRRKGRTTRPTPTRPSSTLRATTRTQRKRKNTSFRLQREPWSSLLPLSVSVYLSFFFSLYSSQFSFPPLTTAPVVSVKNP